MVPSVFAKSLITLVLPLLVATAYSLVAEELRIETVLVKGGKAVLGSPIKDTENREYHADECQVSVSISSFKMGKTPVTARQFCFFLNEVARADGDVSKFVVLDQGALISTIEKTEI